MNATRNAGEGTVTKLTGVEPVYAAYEFEPGHHYEDGTPSKLGTLARGVSLYEAKLALEAEQVQYWDPELGEWIYDESGARQFTIVPLDANGDPMWNADNNLLDTPIDLDWDDVVCAAGATRRVLLVVAVEQHDRLQTEYERLWADGAVVVGVHVSHGMDDVQAWIAEASQIHGPIAEVVRLDLEASQ